MRRRPVTTSLAWLVVLLFVPIIGVFAYFMVGETRLGGRRVAAYLRVSRDLDRLAVNVWKHQCAVEEMGDAHWGPTARFGTAVGNFPPVRGNRLKFIGDTNDFLAALVAEINTAKHHVHLVTYIWRPAPGLEPVAEALTRAATRGVECRVLVDAVGSKRLLRSPWFQKMRQAGVRIVAALPVNPIRMLFARIDLRNHRKIVVIDGRVAFVGSHNMTDTTFRSNPLRNTGPWIDASARIEGPAAQPLALVFLRDWVLDCDETLTDLSPYFPDIDCLPDGSPVQVVPSGPGPTPEAIHQAILTLLYAAREEIVMTTPYFVPDDAMRMALQAAALRGVAVTIIMPSVSDSPVVAAASRSHYLDLLEAGVKIMHYTRGLLHAKTITVDRDIGMLGSANIDQRSFFLNFEVSMFIYDDDAASVLRFMQVGYLADCYEVTLADWRRRPLHEVFVENTAQLLGPLL